MNRRNLLAGSLGAPFGAPFLQAAHGAQSKVERLEVFRIPVNHRGDWLLVRVTTSDGITGIGDASHARDEKRTEELIPQFFEFLKGRSFHDIEPLRRMAWPLLMKEGINAAVALSGLEQCLWDIAGKAHGVPVWQLLGGRLHGEIRCYANINRCTTDRTPGGFSKWAERAIGSGFDAVKLAPFDGMPKDAGAAEAHTRLGLECASAVRKTIGKNDLLIDAHSHFSAARGLQLARELEPLSLYWLEEVCPGIEGLAAINREAKMQTAGGESLVGVQGYFPYLAGKAVDVAMPDVKYCGGLLELKKIAGMAEGAGNPVSPHGPASPVGHAAAVQICATLPNFLILEYAYGEAEWRGELIEPHEEFRKGRSVPGDKPGFGITLNDAAIRRRRAG